MEAKRRRLEAYYSS